MTDTPIELSAATGAIAATTTDSSSRPTELSAATGAIGAPGADGSLGGLVGGLRDEPGVTAALGDPTARLAVPEVARPLAIAGLAHLSNRRPLVVACPTGTMAAQLADDLARFLPPGAVAHVPAWETLPFERVSPNVETMGARLEVLWRLQRAAAGADEGPAVVVAGVRALLQKLGPGATDVEPIELRPGGVVDPDRLTEELVRFGYRREELVEHRGEFARRLWQGQTLDLAVRPKLNRFNGRTSVELEVVDLDAGGEKPIVTP